MEIKMKGTEWNLKPLEGNFEEKRKQWQLATNNFVNKWKSNSKYLTDPIFMKEALVDYEKWANDYGTQSDELYYYWLKTHQNQNDPEIKAKFNKIEEFSKEIANKIKFFTLNISKIPEKEQNKFLNYNELKDYKHFLENIFKGAKHVLSENEEKIMTLKSTSAYSSWIKMTSELLSKQERKIIDEDGKEKNKTMSDLLSLIRSKNKKVRDSAALAFNEILKKYVEIAEFELNAILQDKKVDDDLRHFAYPDEERHLGDDIDPDVVDSLIQAVSGKFKIAKDYYKLKAKLIGVKKLEYHERNVEYGSTNKEYTYEESVKLVGKVFSNLDKKFFDLFKMFVENEQIDVFPKKGKRDGAFCVHFLKTQPTYILLNHTNKLNDVKTLAHELGHAINNELIKEKQNSLNFETPLSTAEVASTFMEDFVIEELMKQADDELKLSLMMQKLEGDVSTIFRQIACYMFERELHKEFRKKGYLSKEEIGKLFQKHMEDYMGDYVEQSEGSENWWVYWGHIRAYFYNYSYASGLLISKALQGKVRKEKKFIEKVKEFLSAGTSKSPKDIFLEIGLDITKEDFWDSGLKEIELLLKETENLAKKLNKI